MRNEVESPASHSAFRIPHSTFILLLLTIFAGLIRFIYIDHPVIWGDEAATYSRVCGTFEQMLQVLEEDAFTPLHYELYWWLHTKVWMTPFWMRFVPALAGTLMVPAVYFLARQMVGKRPA